MNHSECQNVLDLAKQVSWAVNISGFEQSSQTIKPLSPLCVTQTLNRDVQKVITDNSKDNKDLCLLYLNRSISTARLSWVYAWLISLPRAWYNCKAQQAEFITHSQNELRVMSKKRSKSHPNSIKTTVGKEQNSRLSVTAECLLCHHGVW